MSGYRNRTQWTTATDNELLEKFRQLSTQTRIPASRLLDEAIEDLLVKYAVMTKEENPAPEDNQETMTKEEKKNP